MKFLLMLAMLGIPAFSASIPYTYVSAGMDTNDGRTSLIGCMDQQTVYGDGASAGCSGSAVPTNGGFASGSASASAGIGALHVRGDVSAGGTSLPQPYEHASAGGLAGFVDYLQIVRPGATSDDPATPFSGTLDVLAFLDGGFTGDSSGDYRLAHMWVQLDSSGH